MKTVAVVLLLVSFAQGQDSRCWTTEDSKTIVLPCASIPRKNQWRELPPSKSWTQRHRTLLTWLGLGAGAGIGFGIGEATKVNCTHYPPGYSGVRVHCPVAGSWK